MTRSSILAGIALDAALLLGTVAFVWHSFGWKYGIVAFSAMVYMK